MKRTSIVVTLVASAIVLWGSVAVPQGPHWRGGPPMQPDTRRPLPLTSMMAERQKGHMRDHLAAVQEIVAALAADDLAAAAKAAKRIGSSEIMAQMCRHMGAAAPGFSEMALSFHRTADTIVTAAEKGDAKGAAAALGATLGVCVGCHATYKHEVVEASEWQELADKVPNR